MKTAIMRENPSISASDTARAVWIEQIDMAVLLDQHAPDENDRSMIRRRLVGGHSRCNTRTSGEVSLYWCTQM